MVAVYWVKDYWEEPLAAWSRRDCICYFEVDKCMVTRTSTKICFVGTVGCPKSFDLFNEEFNIFFKGMKLSLCHDVNHQYSFSQQARRRYLNNDLE